MKWKNVSTRTTATAASTDRPIDPIFIPHPRAAQVRPSRAWRTFEVMKRILAADDDPAIRFVIKNTLGSDFDLTLAENGEQVMTLLTGDPNWACIVLDVDMPRKTGMDVLREMKASPILRSIPVIILTGVADLKTEVEALKGGVVTYFHKPFSPSQLRSVVTATTRNR